MSKIDIRDAFFDRVYDFAKNNPNIFFISADMDAFSLRKLSKDFPNQYLNVGVSEQNMINVACGLAISGKSVFCYSIASFATLRCLEQIKVNICSMNLPVTIIGAGAGFSFGYDGPTHHGHQDISSMRLMPEMNILELSSIDAASLAVDYALKIKSPCYIRLDKGFFPNFTNVPANFNQGFRVLRPLGKTNIVSSGFMINEILHIADQLKEKNYDFGVVDISRIKPFPKNFLKQIINKSNKLISIEESCKTGGVGTILSEIFAQNNVKCQFQIISSPDKQFLEYGDRSWFLEKYQLKGNHLANRIIKFIED